MNELAIGDGVRVERVSAPREVEAILRSLPVDLRVSIASELDERGQAQRLDGHSHCVYHLCREGDDIVMMTWGPTSTLLEAAILLSSIKTLAKPLDTETAVQLYHRATNHRIECLFAPKRNFPATTPDFWSARRLESTLRALQRLRRYSPLRWRSPARVPQT